MKKFGLTLLGLVVVGVAAHAGGLGDAIVEMSPPAPSDPAGADSGGSSLPGWVLPVAIAAVLIGAATLSGDDDNEDYTP